MKHKILKPTINMIGLVSLPLFGYSQSASEPSTSLLDFSLDLNMVLTLIAVILLLPLYTTTNSFLAAARDNFKRSNKNILPVILLLLMSNLAFGQGAVSATSTSGFHLNTLSYLILILIVFEVLLITALNHLSHKFLNNEQQMPMASNVNPAMQSDGLWTKISKKWAKMNNFVPLADEDKIDTGHSYDGIRELDNATPTWFTAGFLATIVFAIFYFYQRHIAYSVPTQLDEFHTEMAEAAVIKARFLDSQSNSIDENSVVMLGGSDIDAGHTIFIQKCAVCHAENGASMPGGVGPNLTDAEWLHGGSIKNIFITIKYGVPEKGMISWKDQLSPNAMAQTSSYIASIANTNVPGGKEAQGEVYKPEEIEASK